VDDGLQPGANETAHEGLGLARASPAANVIQLMFMAWISGSQVSRSF
jgi:hypothetical protein